MKSGLRVFSITTVIAFMLIAAFYVGGCSNNEPETKNVALLYVDDTGEEISFDLPPERIVSMTPAVTESLYLLGMEDKIVGVTTYCTRPEEAMQKEKIGTVISPSIEKIVELAPDTVFAAGNLNKTGVIDNLREIGIRVFIFGSRNSFQEICDDLRMLGKIVGKEKEAEAIIEQSSREIENISKQVEGLEKKTVFWQIGDEPIVTVSNGTFAQELIELAGGINIAEGSDLQYMRYSVEEVVKQDPDVIIVVTMGSMTEEAKHTWTNLEDMKAVRTGNVFVIEASSVCAPTPLSFVEGLKQVVSFIHPEVDLGD